MWKFDLTGIKDSITRVCHVARTEGVVRLFQILLKKTVRWKEGFTGISGDDSAGQAFEEAALLFQKRILVVDHKVITPDRDSASYRMFHLLKLFQRMGYGVWFSSIHLEEDALYSEKLRKEGIFVLTSANTRSLDQFLEVYGSAFDLLLFSRVTVFEKLIDQAIRCAPKAQVIFDTVDLHFLREERMAQFTMSKCVAAAALNMKKRELDGVRKSDVTLVVSPYEKTLLETLSPGSQIEIVSNIHEVAGPGKSFQERKDLLFIGGFDHQPNVDAMLFFVNDIFPIIQKEMASPVTLIIVGSDPPKKIRKLKSPHIIVTGYVANVSPFFEKARVFVAPLPYGAGVKGKVNMSMSYGLPVVGTAIAAEGMMAVDGKDILIADDPVEFAKKVVQVYSDESLWRHISANSRKVIETCFSIEVAEKRLRSIISPEECREV